MRELRGDDPSNLSRIRLRPLSETFHISRGRTVLATSHDGEIQDDQPDQGLYVNEARMLSRYRWTLNGKPPKLSAQSAVAQHSWLGYLYAAPANCRSLGECDPLQQTIEMRLTRVVGEGLHEDIELTNHTQIATDVSLALNADADFLAHEEAAKPSAGKGRTSRSWKESGRNQWQWAFQHHRKHSYNHQGERGTALFRCGITLDLHAQSKAVRSGSSITFSIRLQPHASWRACLIWRPQFEDSILPVEEQCNAFFASTREWSQKTRTFLSSATRFHTTAPGGLSSSVQRILDRSIADLAALRLFDSDDSGPGWCLAAGVPSYLAIFARDMLGAAWQSSILCTDMSLGPLRLFSERQTRRTNDWRDEQPGRMLHESHADPLSVLNYKPSSAYYGTVSSPTLYPIVLCEYWHWTGDRDAVAPFIQPALNALAWSDKFSRSRDGFYRYLTHSEKGMKNQGWKDSDDAMVYADGSQVEPPLGTCEMQAFAYAAKLEMSELLWSFGESAEARRLFSEARNIKKLFNETFFMKKKGYVAMAIDSRGKLARTISSDAGHCLLSGILEKKSVRPVVRRMFQSDLFSGWGIRTLSSDHPAYNPFSYHRGTIWPVENASFVMGLARYGLHAPMWLLARAVFESAVLFEYDRLPELLGGHPRDALHPFPCLYQHANSPQAWSASAPLLMLQALLGLYPYAPLNLLLLDPWLPDWLPEIFVRNMHVGNARVDLHFQRRSDGRTDYRVEHVKGKLHVLRQPSPWSLTAKWGERFRDALASLLPGK